MTRRVWGEISFLFALLSLVAGIWSAGDFALHQPYIHPYLLAILVIGARHGVAPSLMATGVAVTLLMVFGQFSTEPLQPQQLLQRPWSLVLASWVVLGACVGSILDATKLQRDRLATQLEELQGNFEEHKSRLDVVESENVELRKKVLGEGETLSTVYEMARRLTTLQGSDLFHASLELVERFVGATQCSIYMLDEERKQFELMETRGLGRQPAKTPLPRGEALLEKCLSEERVVSVRDLFTAERARQSIPGVIAAPLGKLDESRQQTGVLLVHELPLEGLNPEALGVFELLSDWVSRSLTLVHRYEEEAEGSTGLSIISQLRRQRLTSAAIQTLSRYAPTYDLALKVLADTESPEIATWNASRMLAVTSQTNESFSKDLLQDAIRALMDNGTHLGAVLVSLPIRPEFTGCTGLRLRIQERAELNSQAALRLLKLYVTRFHGDLITELHALESGSSPSRRQFHLDNLLDGIEYLRAKKHGVSFCLGLSRPLELRTTTRDLLLGLTYDRDRWTQRFAVIASKELGFPVEARVLESLRNSDDPLDLEVGSLEGLEIV